MNEIETHARFQRVVAGAVQPAVRQIIAQPDSPLGEILRAQTASDQRILARIVEQSCSYVGRFGPRVATIPVPGNRSLVEPRAAEMLVLEGADAHRIGVIQRRLERRVEIEVTEVGLEAVAETELGGRVVAGCVRQLPKDQGFTER